MSQCIQHLWSQTALINGDGGMSVPCSNPECEAELRIVTHGFATAIDGVRLNLLDDPMGTVVKIVCREATEHYRLGDIAPTLPERGTVLDVGAHVGAISCYLGKVRPDLAIAAIEPWHPNFTRLLHNLAANEVSNVHALEMAVSGDARDLMLRGDPGRNSGGITAFTKEGSRFATVKSATLEHIAAVERMEHIDLLKIDCEGAEHEVLTDALLDKVTWLVGEFHDGAGLPDAAALLRQVTARLGAEHVRVNLCRIG